MGAIAGITCGGGADQPVDGEKVLNHSWSSVPRTSAISRPSDQPTAAGLADSLPPRLRHGSHTPAVRVRYHSAASPPRTKTAVVLPDSAAAGAPTATPPRSVGLDHEPSVTARRRVRPEAPR